MMSEVDREFERLSRVHERLGHPLLLAPPATEAQLTRLEETTGIRFGEELKALWRISNGSRNRLWFATGDDWEINAYRFVRLACFVSWRCKSSAGRDGRNRSS